MKFFSLGGVLCIAVLVAAVLADAEHNKRLKHPKKDKKHSDSDSGIQDYPHSKSDSDSRGDRRPPHDKSSDSDGKDDRPRKPHHNGDSEGDRHPPRDHPKHRGDSDAIDDRHKDRTSNDDSDANDRRRNRDSDSASERDNSRGHDNDRSRDHNNRDHSNSRHHSDSSASRSRSHSSERSIEHVRHEDCCQLRQAINHLIHLMNENAFTIRHGRHRLHKLDKAVHDSKLAQYRTFNGMKDFIENDIRKGWVGSPGAKGEAGTNGFKGPQGHKGEHGSKGDHGKSVPGPVGDIGVAGENGTVGPKGDKGLAGGSIGAKGAPGAPGVNSTVAGAAGSQGPQGPNGTSGDKGVKGSKGSSIPAPVQNDIHKFCFNDRKLCDVSSESLDDDDSTCDRQCRRSIVQDGKIFQASKCEKKSNKPVFLMNTNDLHMRKVRAWPGTPGTTRPTTTTTTTKKPTTTHGSADVCNDWYCSNRGKCSVDQQGKFKCKCLTEQFTGDRCQEVQQPERQCCCFYTERVAK